MKKTVIAFLILLIAGAASPAYALDLKELLGGIVGSKSPAGVEAMAGSWKYDSPAVSFKSNNLLRKAGGAAASLTVEKKLEPYYRKAGLDKLVFTVGADSTFTIAVGKARLSGTIVPSGESADKESKSAARPDFTMSFKAFGKIPAGSMDAYVNISGNKMDLMFDVKRLVSLVEKVGALTGSSSAKSIASLLKGYDGICAGFGLVKEAQAKK